MGKWLFFFLYFIVYNSANNPAIAQCTNWNISTQLITGSTCAGNGGFSVSVSGIDAANLAQIQYGIAASPNGYTVPLNNSNVFSGVPPGTYTISVVALCGGKYVGKNAIVKIPGTYTPPQLTLQLLRHNLSCGAYGIITASVDNNRPPYALTILSKPASYTGPTSFTMSGSSTAIRNLTGGNYTLQVVDACGNSSFPAFIVVPDSAAPAINLVGSSISNIGCDTITIATPDLSGSSNWSGYKSDTLYKVSVQISNNAFPATGFIPLSAAGFKIKLSPGFSLKDCYGQTITYTIKPPCGTNFQITQTVPSPALITSITQKCNISFTGQLFFQGPICYPVTCSITDAGSSASYGNFMASGNSAVMPSLPLGTYLIHYTTADGYSGTQPIGASPVTGTPYQVAALSGANGLHNYIQGFQFTTNLALGDKTIELFSGPAGYTYYDLWNGTLHIVSENQTPVSPGTLLFPAGNYVWKITDSCGVYYLPITVPNSNLYQFTAALIKQKQTCQGLWIFPVTTAQNGGVPVPSKFSILKNGRSAFVNPNPPYNWQQFTNGDSILLTDPGIYTIVPSAGSSTLRLQQPYPNPYTQTFSFTYVLDPVQIDVHKTGGYACSGSGSSTIVARGKDGIPFSGNNYQYYLALNGNGISGPYIANNMTGIFTGFGGVVNAVYDVKVVDSCGSFAVQRVKILDLQTSRTVSSSKYVGCDGDSIQLAAPHFLNATYSWTGPNGFNAAIANPTLYHITAATTGVYHVYITIPGCILTVHDSTIITVNPKPSTPVIASHCGPLILLTINNVQPGYTYTWDYSPFWSHHGFELYDENDTVAVYDIAYYRAIAIDSSTGCMSDYSDTLMFSGITFPFKATIYSPHLQLCAGDTTTLVANSGASNYQWFRNGMTIAGATSQTYVTNTPGSYKVYVDADKCAKDTSDEVTVTIVAMPLAHINAPDTVVCHGDTAFIYATNNPSYQYTWFRNGISVPEAQGAVLGAYQTGTYYAVISNGGCIAISDTVVITVLPSPNINLLPATDQLICPGTSVNFSTTFHSAYSYAWLRNNTSIGNANNNQYQAATAGSYRVVVSDGTCTDTSQSVAVTYLPTTLTLPDDTIFCEFFSYLLDIGEGYYNILWSTGDTTRQINLNQGGRYWVKASNDCGTYSDTFRIYTLEDIKLRLPDDTTICNSSMAALLSVSPMLTDIQWSNGATTASTSIAQPGLYWVKAESPCGMLRDTILVHFCSPVIEDITLVSDTICEGECIHPVAVVRNYPQHFEWSFQGGNPGTFSGSNPGSVCYPSPGVYNIQLIASHVGGADTFDRLLAVLATPRGRFTDTAITAPYKTFVSLPSCGDAAETDWYENDSLICENCGLLSFEAKRWRSLYRCVIRSSSCSDTCTYVVHVTNIPSEVWLPTAFSPNGDGKNDRFSVVTDNPNVEVISFLVYNRWGQQAFRSSGNALGWDGTYNGTTADIGVYFWYLKYKITGSDKTYEMKGDVTVVR
ncbi:MAG TPA: gliding motility-associated C-terminal domain-containing protein [Flavipsychrobacter sp.]|nr:gliding motility-associated C-terminal domain-containing protein [Flavipsychrobacter sp.]